MYRQTAVGNPAPPPPTSSSGAGTTCYLFYHKLFIYHEALNVIRPSIPHLLILGPCRRSHPSIVHVIRPCCPPTRGAAAGSPAARPGTQGTWLGRSTVTNCEEEAGGGVCVRSCVPEGRGNTRGRGRGGQGSIARGCEGRRSRSG